nr:phosphate transporter PHO1 homolog 10 isoform X1 [Tanacetum cinerariifolium]
MEEIVDGKKGENEGDHGIIIFEFIYCREHRHTVLNVNDDRTNNHGQDPLDILDRVRMNNTLEDPMSTITSVLNDSKDKDLRFKKAELEVAEGRLKVVFVEFIANFVS